MKARITANLAILAAILVMSIAFSLVWAQSSGIRKPERDNNGWLDEQGRFWVYRNGIPPDPNDEELIRIPPYGVPFLPYAWMSDRPEKEKDIIKFEPNHQQSPYESNREADKCISVSIGWIKENFWAGVAFVSGPDKDQRGAPWWGKTDHGWYYDLSKLENKRLVFHLRGENGGEKVRFKVGIFGKEKYGDSLPFPIMTEWLELEKGWQRYALDLSEENLTKVCSLCFVVERLWQKDQDADVTFYIDTVYFE